MKPIRWTILLLLLLTTTASAALVTGRHTSCAAVWDTGTAAVIAPHLDCLDGDTTCDTDGAADHVCHVAIKACVDTPSGACTPTPLTKLKFGAGIAKLTGFSPPAIGSPNCGAAGTAAINLRSRKHGRVLKPSRPLRLLMRGKPRFKSTLLVRCLPNPNPVTTTTTIPGGACPPGQKELVLTVPVADRAHPELGNGSDLDNGWTGTSHNFPVIGGSTLKYCLSGCDGTTTFDCQAGGTTAANGGDPTQTLNGATFGAPLPLLAANVPVCVVNQFQDSNLTGKFNLQTGESSSQVNLFSLVYLTTSFPGEVCPKCSGSGIRDKGTCSASSKNAGGPCTVNGEVTVAGKGLYELSSDCPPKGDSPPTKLDIRLPFTTGTTSSAPGPKPCPGQTQDDTCGGGTCNSQCTGAACVGMNAGQCIDAKGGISQLCCSNNTAIPCFPTRGGTITRAGTPAAPGGTQVAAASFCIPATDSTLINVTTGLPGPGALLLPSQVSVRP
jgi:hypothetical protein